MTVSVVNPADASGPIDPPASGSAGDRAAIGSSAEAHVGFGEQLRLVEVGHRTGQRRRRMSIPRPVRRWYGPVLLLAIWTVASALHLLSPDAFATPGQVISAARELISDGTLQTNLLASLHRVGFGLAIGIAVGTTIAVIAGLTRAAEDVVDSSMQVLKAIPTYAWVPLLMIWAGIGETPKILLIALGVTVQMYVNVYSGIRDVDAQLVEAARTFGVGRLGLIGHVILPGSLPGFLTGLRLSMANAWLGLIFAETVNAPTGLGTLMNTAAANFRTDIVVLIVVIYALIGLLSYAFVRLLGRVLLSWRRGFEGE